MDDEPDDANSFTGQQVLTELPRDSTTDRDRNSHVGGAASANALSPVVNVDLVDSTHRTRAHPANVFDLRVRHVAGAVTSP